MRHSFFALLAAASVIFFGSAHAAEAIPHIGIVNFRECVEQSQIGKQEQQSFEAMRKQMGQMLEKLDKEIADLNGKLEDSEFVDGLSPQAEKEMQIKLAQMNEEFAAHQNQYFQVLNQANMRLLQSLSEQVAAAAKKVAADKQLNLVLNEEVAFAFSPAYDVTKEVITVMDADYAKNYGQSAPQAIDAPAAK